MEQKKLTSNEIRTLVFNNLTSAAGNGAFDKDEHLDGLTAGEIAYDMTVYADDAWDLEAEELKPYVEEWLNLRQTMDHIFKD